MTLLLDLKAQHAQWAKLNNKRVCGKFPTDSFAALFAFFQNFKNEFPNSLNGGDGHSLGGGVDILHIGADGNAVKLRDFCGKKTALKTRMDGQNLTPASPFQMPAPLC